MNPQDFAVGYTTKQFDAEFVYPWARKTYSNGIVHLHNAMSQKFIDEVNQWFNQSTSQRANLNGKKVDKADVGSDRISVFDITSSELLFAHLQNFVPKIYNGASDLAGILEFPLLWETCGVNPLWRGIRYNPGDALVAHYDDTYAKSESEKSLMSIVMYFSTGSTRFMTDPRENHNYSDYGEWTDEVDIEVDCAPGDILIFDHRLFHDGPKVSSEKRIIRTDLMFKKI